jgi:predicted flap endonuclease-1-like 5' DNA nuclease
MAQPQVVTRDTYRQQEAIRADIGRPMFLFGILLGLIGLLLYQTVVLNYIPAVFADQPFAIIEAAMVFFMLGVPLILWSLTWEVRAYRWSYVLGSLGILLCIGGTLLFTLAYPTNFNVWMANQTDHTLMVVNVYGLGILLLFTSLYVGHTLRVRDLRHLGLVAAVPVTTPAPAPPVATARVQPAPAPPPPIIRTVPFLGDVEDVSIIEGLDGAAAERLRASNIHTTMDLLARPAQDLAKETGLDASRVETWQSMADLIRIKGIGPQYADLLVRSGVRSLPELAQESPVGLMRRFDRLEQADGGSRIRFSVATSSEWIRQARDLIERQNQASSQSHASAPMMSAEKETTDQ